MSTALLGEDSRLTVDDTFFLGEFGLNCRLRTKSIQCKKTHKKSPVQELLPGALLSIRVQDCLCCCAAFSVFGSARPSIGQMQTHAAQRGTGCTGPYFELACSLTGNATSCSLSKTVCISKCLCVYLQSHCRVCFPPARVKAG